MESGAGSQRQNPTSHPFTSCSLVFTAVLLIALLPGCRGREDGAGKTVTPPHTGAEERADTAGDFEAGKAVYEKYCRYCHGEKGAGDGVVATALTPHPADFVNDTKRMSKSDEELLKSITAGVQRDMGGKALSMPGWKSILTKKERQDVLAYVRKLEREGRKGAGTPQPGAGKAVQ